MSVRQGGEWLRRQEAVLGMVCGVKKRVQMDERRL